MGESPHPQAGLADLQERLFPLCFGLLRRSTTRAAAAGALSMYRHSEELLNWDDLKVLLAAYREGSIGCAAEALGVSGSTVSRRLSALERALGQDLFVRTPDGLKPTEAGTHAWAEAQRAEAPVLRMQFGLDPHQEPRGVVRVAVSPELLHCALLPRWQAFSTRYPKLSVEFIEGVGLTDLERWEAEIAIRTVRPGDSDHLRITKLREFAIGLFGTRALLAAHGIAESKDAALLACAQSGWADWPWVDWTPEFADMPLAQARGQLAAHARVVARLSNMESIRLAASASVGLALLPRFFGAVSPNLVELPQPGAKVVGSLFLVGLAAVRHTPRVQAVWDYLASMLRGGRDAQSDGAQAAISAAYGVTYSASEHAP